MTDDNPYQAPRAVSVKDTGTSPKQAAHRPPWHYAVGALAACLVPALGWFLGGLSDGALGGGHGSPLPGLLFLGLPLGMTDWLPAEQCGLGVYSAYVLLFVIIWKVFSAGSAARIVLLIHTVSALSGMVICSYGGWGEKMFTDLGKVSRLLGLPFYVACAAFLLLTIIVIAVAIKGSATSAALTNPHKR